MSVADTSEYEGAFGALVRQARRQGGLRGFEGVFTNPSFWLPKDFIHLLAKWSTTVTAIENHHCPNKFVCSYAHYGTRT